MGYNDVAVVAGAVVLAGATFPATDPDVPLWMVVALVVSLVGLSLLRLIMLRRTRDDRRG